MLARSHIQESSMKRKRKGKGKGIKENTLAFDFTEAEYMYKVNHSNLLRWIILSCINFKESLINFTYPVGGEDDDASDGTFRTVILFPVEKLESILTALQHELI